jgi:nicotinamidase-related amidase
MSSDNQATTRALLVLDMQYGNVGMLTEPAQQRLVEAVGVALEQARAAGIPRIFVRAAFREGHPEIAAANKIFGPLAANGVLKVGSPEAEIVEPLQPRADETVVDKKRIDPFLHTDLEAILRAQGITSVGLVGVSTNHVVESTARSACDRDFEVSVLADGCAGLSDADSDYALEHILPFFATVTTSQAFLGEAPA